MPSNAQKTPFAESLHRFGDIKSQDWLSRLPQDMPATVTGIVGALVQVSIDGNWSPFSIPQIIVPKSESAYAREPTKIGDKGIVRGVNFYVGGQSGQGGGTANLYPRANLTNAVWEPISQKSFATADPNQYTITGGSAGVLIQDATAMCKISITSAGMTVTIGGIVILSVTAAGVIAGFGGADSVSMQQHTHASNGVPPTPGT